MVGCSLKRNAVQRWLGVVCSATSLSLPLFWLNAAAASTFWVHTWCAFVVVCLEFMLFVPDLYGGCVEVVC